MYKGCLYVCSTSMHCRLPPTCFDAWQRWFFFLLLLLLRLMACELCLRWTMRWYFQSLSYVCCIECDRKTTPAFESILNISLSLSIMFPPLLCLGNVWASVVHLVVLKLHLSCTSVSRIYCCLHVFSWNLLESSQELSFYVRHVCAFRPCCLLEAN